MKEITIFVLSITCFVSAMAQEPAAPQKKRILLYGGTAHIGNGEVIENSLIIIENGEILTVEDASRIRIDISDAEYFDLIGKHVYPGFILPNTTLGLADVDAIRATLDYDEVGDLNPHIRSFVAYNTDSPVIPTIRTNGVLLGQICPRGGVVSGSSSLVEFDGWNYEDAIYKKDEGIHLNWPSYPRKISNSKDDLDDLEVNNRTIELEEIEEFFRLSKSYLKSNNEKIDLRLEAMKGLFGGFKTLYIHVETVKQIKEAVIFSQNMEIKKVVLVGAQDAWRIADFLSENNIPVILNRVHRLPLRSDEDIDISYKSPKILHDAGVLYCLDYQGDMERMGSRNLPFTAGTTAAYGLSKEEALMSITLSAAKILGIEARVGSLEVGKDATLVVSDGDALNVLTNQISLAFIRGKKLDLSNHQTRLYDKYKKHHREISKP
jgi:imidazolonepropionase-like amidohydrolase